MSARDTSKCEFSQPRFSSNIQDRSHTNQSPTQNTNMIEKVLQQFWPSNVRDVIYSDKRSILLPHDSDGQSRRLAHRPTMYGGNPEHNVEVGNWKTCIWIYTKAVMCNGSR